MSNFLFNSDAELFLMDSNRNVKVVTYEQAEKAFSYMLKNIREYANISGLQLSKLIGISQQALNNYENGKRVPDFTVAMKIAGYFGCTLNDFILSGLGMEIIPDIYERYDLAHKE